MARTSLANKLREQGERDSKAEKPVESFYEIPNIRHNETNRAQYEIGYRAAQADKWAAAAKYWKDKHDALIGEV